MALSKITNLSITDDTILNADVNSSAAIALSKLATDPSNATNLASGTVPTARLGSGTASSTTILYGDQTYKTEPSGFDVSSITGQTALTSPPDASADDLVLSDGGTLKKTAFQYIYNRPAFHAYQSDALRGVSDDTITNMPISTANELFDTDAAFNTTSKQFLPLVAGKYFVYGAITSNTAWDYAATLTLVKNDSAAGVSATQGRFADGGVNYQSVMISGIFDLDGVDDFVECQIYQNSGHSRDTSNKGMENFWGAFRIPV